MATGNGKKAAGTGKAGASSSSPSSRKPAVKPKKEPVWGEIDGETVDAFKARIAEYLGPPPTRGVEESLEGYRERNKKYTTEKARFAVMVSNLGVDIEALRGKATASSEANRLPHEPEPEPEPVVSTSRLNTAHPSLNNPRRTPAEEGYDLSHKPTQEVVIMDARAKKFAAAVLAGMLFFIFILWLFTRSWGGETAKTPEKPAVAAEASPPVKVLTQKEYDELTNRVKNLEGGTKALAEAQASTNGEVDKIQKAQKELEEHKMAKEASPKKAASEVIAAAPKAPKRERSTHLASSRPSYYDSESNIKIVPRPSLKAREFREQDFAEAVPPLSPLGHRSSIGSSSQASINITPSRPIVPVEVPSDTGCGVKLAGKLVQELSPKPGSTCADDRKMFVQKFMVQCHGKGGSDAADIECGKNIRL